jgi:hypothetical protein
MRILTASLTLTGVCLGGILNASIAYADAIDGNWCSAEGRHLSIAGSAVTTPGGAHITGDYTRHAFSYFAPAGEEGAGSSVQMRLMNEDEVRISFPAQAPVVWHRCKLETS